jgi:peroxiredoxin
LCTVNQRPFIRKKRKGHGAFPDVDNPHMDAPSPPVTISRRDIVFAPAALVALWGSGCAQSEPAPTASYLLLDGSRLHSDTLKGQVVLVNFWATSCVSCVKEMPDLVSTHQRFSPRGYETIAVAMSYDPPSYVLNFAQSRNLPFKVALDHTGELARLWGDVRLTPTTFLVNRRGQIVKRYVGEPDFPALHRLLDDLLSQSA